MRAYWDRESDIYKLFCSAQESGTKFLLRTYVDRLSGDGKHTIAAAMRRAKVKAIHRVEVRDAKGTVSEATVRVKYHRLKVYPPIGKQKQYPPLMLTVIHASESLTPRGRDKIDWKLITNLPVRSHKAALEKLTWYAMRWRIETFHKILKSGCKAEASRLRTAERIVNLIAVFCIPQLENLLDDDDEPRGSCSLTADCTDTTRNSLARRTSSG